MPPKQAFLGTDDQSLPFLYQGLNIPKSIAFHNPLSRDGVNGYNLNFACRPRQSEIRGC
jgi:hypothetical protein